MADAPREVTIQVRLTASEAATLEQIGRRMATWYSGIRKLDGSVNQSAVVRRLIQEEQARGD